MMVMNFSAQVSTLVKDLFLNYQIISQFRSATVSVNTVNLIHQYRRNDISQKLFYLSI